MFQVIHCYNCGGNLKGTPFYLSWEYDLKQCDKCHNIERKEMHYDFCSSKCLKEFVNKFHGHKHKWLKDERMTGIIDNKETGEKMVLKRCKICNVVEQRKATKQDIKEYQKTIEAFFGDKK